MRHAGRIVVDVGGPVSVVDWGPLVESRPGATPVVCVHGLGSSAVSWQALARALGPEHRVLAVDLPGHGRSPAAGRSLAPPDQATVVAGVIEELGLGPVHLVGHSMGAMISVFLASSRPDLVAELCLLAPPVPRRGFNVCSPSVVPHVALCLFPRVGTATLRRRRARQGVQAYIEDGLRLTCGEADLGELATALAEDFRAAREHGEDPIESFLEAARSVGALVASATRYRAALASVTAPTQLLHGGADRVVRPSGLAQLEELQPCWPTAVLPGVGHSPHMEVPLVVAAAVRDAEIGQPQREALSA